MTAVGERAPDAQVWLAPNEPVRVRDLVPEGEALLLVFYLLDWSST